MLAAFRGDLIKYENKNWIFLLAKITLEKKLKWAKKPLTRTSFDDLISKKTTMIGVMRKLASAWFEEIFSVFLEVDELFSIPVKVKNSINENKTNNHTM